MKPTLLLFLALCTLAGCKKTPTSGPTSAEGQVVDAQSNKPVYGVLVYVRATDDSQVGALAAVGLSPMRTAEDGRYSFSFDAKEGFSYAVWADDSKYYHFDNVGISLAPGKASSNLSLKLHPKGFVRVHPVNEPPRDTLEYFSMNYISNSLSNVSKDISFIIETSGGETRNISCWTKKKDGPKEQSAYTMFFPALDTADFTIKY